MSNFFLELVQQHALALRAFLALCASPTHLGQQHNCLHVWVCTETKQLPSCVYVIHIAMSVTCIDVMHRRRLRRQTAMRVAPC